MKNDKSKKKQRIWIASSLIISNTGLGSQSSGSLVGHWSLSESDEKVGDDITGNPKLRIGYHTSAFPVEMHNVRIDC